jgi:hypothetical protein
MGFKEDLKQKIVIDRLAGQVRGSLGPSGSGSKVDKTAMRSLLDVAGYEKIEERGLEIYRHDPNAHTDQILVLDNDLAVYNTTEADVLMRKNPTIKEMVNLFNMKKILNDSDVVVSKGIETLSALRAECLSDLDLTYSESDIRAIAEEGKEALSEKNGSRIQEALELFSELLSLVPPPVSLGRPNWLVLGRMKEDGGRLKAFGPVVFYERESHALRFLDAEVGSRELEQERHLLDIAEGEVSPSLSGAEVFDALAEWVIKEKPEVSA